MPSARLDLAALLLPLIAACALRSTRPPPPQPTGDRDVLTREEILRSPLRDRDLLDALRGLRPRFLRAAPVAHSRASTGSLPTAVYVDGVRQPGLEALATIGASFVEEVRYLSPVAAQNELGAAAGGGAVMVTLHKDARVPPAGNGRASSDLRNTPFSREETMRISVALSLVALVACASSQPGGAIASAPEVPIGSSPVRLRSTGGPTVNVVTFPLEQVWQVLPAVFDSLGIPTTDVDVIQHVIGSSGFKAHKRLRNVALSKLIDCGSTQGFPSADEYDVKLSVLTQVERHDKAATSIATRVEAEGRPMAFSGTYSRCTTTGKLETTIAAAVLRRLQS